MHLGVNCTVLGMDEPIAGVKLQELKTEIGKCQDLMFGQVRRFFDAGVIGKIARRGDNDAPDISPEPGGNERRIRQMADAECNIHTFVHQVYESVEQKKPGRDGRVEIEEVVKHRPEYFLSEDRWCRDRQNSAGGGTLAPCKHVRFFQVSQHPAAGGRIALACFAQLEGAGRTVQEFNPYMRLQEAQGTAHRRRRSFEAAGRAGEATLVDRSDEDFHCINAVHLFCRSSG